MAKPWRKESLSYTDAKNANLCNFYGEQFGNIYQNYKCTLKCIQQVCHACDGKLHKLRMERAVRCIVTCREQSTECEHFFQRRQEAENCTNVMTYAMHTSGKIQKTH